MVYPGAMHTRFEHSLGVMHIATRMFDEIIKRKKDFLESELSYDEAGFRKDRVLVRLSCLLHDVGHAPFSHAAEGLMTKDASAKSYKHENYSAAAVVHLMQDVVEKHPLNQNYGLKAQDIADFLNGSSKLGRSLLWRSLLSSQLDADRADYLLRDSHHVGVAYGKYDLNRLLITMTVAIDPETSSPTLAVEDGGVHTAEALIIARYMMFTQVYFQHTRRAYDHHLALTIKSLLSEAQKDTGLDIKDAFPPPTSRENMEMYLNWNDWRVLGLINDGNGGENGRIIRERSHYRRIYETPEVPTQEDLEFADIVWQKLSENDAFSDKAENSWYKFDITDIPILKCPGERNEELTTLSKLSSVVNGLKAVNQTRIYVPWKDQEAARKMVEELRSDYKRKKGDEK